MAREYSVWNTALAALQFWTADFKAHILSSTIEEVYTAFFYATSAHTLHQQSDKILFSPFMTTLNAAFECKLALEDACFTGEMNQIHYLNYVNSILPLESYP